MAEERDLELLDDYLANRMSDNDRSAFEQKIKADPNLHQEYVLQKRLIQGIKDARAAQLKSMLNQVPVPSHGPGNAIASKVIIGTVVTLMIVGAAYWFVDIKGDKIEQRSVPPSRQLSEKEAVEPSIQPEIKTEDEKPSQRNPQQVQETDKNQTSAGTEHSKPSLAKKPDPVSAPAGKDSKSTGIAPDETPLSVRTESGNREYTFHYQYQHRTVTLHGPFEGKEYQVIELEVEGQRKAFLQYNQRYYSLEPGNAEIRPLTPVTDPGLLKRLDENHRSQ